MGEAGQSVDEQIETPYDPSIHQRRNVHSWGRLLAYTLLILVGESSSTLLGGLYFNGGGNNIFLVALLEFVGFPILIPFYIYFSSRSTYSIYEESSNKTTMTIILYMLLGLLEASCSIMYAIGLQQLPVSTYSLIGTTQLGFNALFAFFLNSEKLTPPTLNAVVLLTISSALLIFQPSHYKNDWVEKGRAENFKVGSFCTLVGSALYALTLSLIELVSDKIIKQETFPSILHMNIFESLISTCAIAVPLSSSGGWPAVMREMENFQHGRVAYMAVVTTSAVASQLQAIGSVGLIIEVSSLFSNVIATVGLPIVPILGAIFFHESLDGIKVISIILAVWGFTSYVYQYR
ncbi:probable purine permease 10 [Salvia hispanica]|uniref:probable purine permease 10 n=1 Tax=Salvia hispanica TaxID=49212 RepID=UPI002009AF44|nr:probable purine permease 10 [Salvia hispanica]